MNAVLASLGAMASMLLGGMLVAHRAEADPVEADPVYYSIQAQPLAQALRDFGEQSKLQILLFAETGPTAAIVTPAVRGTMTHREALQKLLATTDLSYEFVNDRTVRISSSESRAGESRVRHHQTGRMELTPIAAVGESLSAGVAESGSRAPLAASADAAASSVRESEEVVVTGSRLKRAEGEEPSPVTVFDRKKIEQLGASSLPDVLRYSTQQPFMASETNAISGQQFVQLRGLPTGTTAVLINGRRTVVSSSDIGANSINLNMIPLAAIERIEVLADSASAMYGADAVGGVVNVILRKDITRPVAEMRYGGAKDGAQERRASLTTGWSNDRFRASLLADYFDRDPLLGADRDRWANQDYRRFGGTDRRLPNANPGTIMSATNANLRGLSSRFALLPPGTSGVGLTPGNFTAVPTLSDLNVESARRFEQIVLDQTRKSAAGFAEFDLNDTVTMFADVFYTDSEMIDRFRPPVATLGVPANNPFNPFNQALTVRYLFEGIGSGRSTFQQDMYSGAAGVRGRLNEWDWEVSVLGGRSNGDSVRNENANVNTTQANCLLTNPATRAAGACGGITEALNPFQDGPGGSSALLASLISPPSIDESKSEVTQATAFLRGAVFDLPAGPAEVVVGGSGGTEDVSLEQLSPTVISVNGDRSSSAAFAEMRIPLVSAAMQVPAARGLWIKLAARYDHYSDFGDTFNPQYGLVWTPLEGLSWQASYGTSFSPPSLFNLNRPRTSSSRVVTDPQRNENVSIAIASGGNPDLEPEEGRSFITGFVLTPRPLPNLKLSTHYWQVVLEDHPSSFSAEQMLASEALFQDRIVRDAPLATDPPGVPGPLRSVDSSLVNFQRLETSGIDVGASYTIATAWGEFAPSLSATWTERYEAKDSPSLPQQDRVGIASTGTIPRWKGVASLAWARQGVGLSLAARYTHGYSDASLQGGNYVPNGRKISSQVLTDVQASFDVSQLIASQSWFVEELKVSVGASNVFDEEPRFVDLFSDGYDPSQGDLIGRTLYINMSKGF